MKHFIHYYLVTITALIVGLTAQASGTGIYRTAIVLKNGTQEIFPDTLVNKFQYTHSLVQGKTIYSLDVIQDGKVTMSIPIDDIAEINYREMTPYEHFAGDWYLVASPNGEPLPGTSIMVSSAVSMPYHAVLAAPGTPGYEREIYCHIDSMAHRKGLKYDADFKLLYNYDEGTGKGNISMILEHEGGDTGGRHMYFVTHNIDTWELEGQELPCQWTTADLADYDHEYSFPSIYEICWVVGLDIPFVYSEHDLLGYIDIFASPRLMRHPWTKPLTE